jgi:ABC-type glycerol-3-phosphate transport system substrate-binding protein
MSKFQIILTGIFVVCIIGGVIAFATYKGSSTDTKLPAITIWGTFPSEKFTQFVNNVSMASTQQLNITYTQISEANFDKTFIEALARGQGPDAVLLPQDMLHKHEDKVVMIPYSLLTQRTFLDTYIRQAELYLGKNGILALPFVVDPLVMYWNRDSFTNAGIASYPKYWDEFTDLNTKLTVKDVNSNIRKSAIAMGEFGNIFHAREILGTLLLQTGNPVTYRDPNSGESSFLISAIGNTNYQGTKTSLPALNFFTQFSNPRDANYSWNRSLPNSKNFFLSGNLATYFGFASEINDIRAKNPNIDFDIAPIPQIRQKVNSSSNRATYGMMYGFSIVRSSKDVNSALTVLQILLNPKALSEMISLSYLPPVRKDMISQGIDDPYLSIFYDSALISKGWLDTNKVESNRIFQSIVESVTSGRKTAVDALQNGSNEFNISLGNI